MVQRDIYNVKNLSRPNLTFFLITLLHRYLCFLSMTTSCAQFLGWKLLPTTPQRLGDHDILFSFFLYLSRIEVLMISHSKIMTTIHLVCVIYFYCTFPGRQFAKNKLEMTTYKDHEMTHGNPLRKQLSKKSHPGGHSRGGYTTPAGDSVLLVTHVASRLDSAAGHLLVLSRSLPGS